VIAAEGKLFLTDHNILLDLCGMKLLVCRLTCARVVGGHWTLAAYAMPGPLSDTRTKGAFVDCPAISPISNLTACSEG